MDGCAARSDSTRPIARAEMAEYSMSSIFSSLDSGSNDEGRGGRGGSETEAKIWRMRLMLRGVNFSGCANLPEVGTG